MAICIECVHKVIDRCECNNPDLPVTDFVDGTKDCYKLNAKGDCKGFKAIPQRESIYELKSDQELATRPVGTGTDYDAA